MEINGRKIGSSEPPYIVAEIGAGHGGDLAAALELLRGAKRDGADAAKLQTYSPESMTHHMIRHMIREGAWRGLDLRALYQEAATPREWTRPLFEEGRRLGLTVFSTPFSPEDVALLEAEGCPAYKIASCEIEHAPLLEAVRRTGKPVIVSTGMAGPREIEGALAALLGRPTALLHCVSGYPTPIDQANLWRVSALKASYPGRPVGFSDHTNDEAHTAATVAAGLGAEIIEKHVGECWSLDGGFATTPGRFHEFVDAVRRAARAVARNEPVCEEPTRALRRSVWAIKTILPGERLTKDNIALLRPAGGLPAARYGEVLGAKAAEAMHPGDPLREEAIRWSS
jgi:N-acetylneuraminate synthase